MEIVSIIPEANSQNLTLKKNSKKGFYLIYLLFVMQTARISRSTQADQSKNI
jgi:hypothetical protein